MHFNKLYHKYIAVAIDRSLKSYGLSARVFFRFVCLRLTTARSAVFVNIYNATFLFLKYKTV